MKNLYGLLMGLSLCFLLANCAGDSNSYAIIETEYGNMKVLLYDETPKHKENFIPGTMLGAGGPGYLIDAEIGSPHFKGSLAAARTGAGNPEKKSSGSQFYIVEGAPVTEVQITALENFKKIKYSDAQRAVYAELGGRPDLDQEYTVFGEVVEGLDIIDKISLVPVDAKDRPIKDVKMKVRMQ